MINKKTFNKRTLICSTSPGERCAHPDWLFSSLQIPVSGMIIVASQPLAHCACASHTVPCEWSRRLLRPLTCPRRFQEGWVGMGVELPMDHCGGNGSWYLSKVGTSPPQPPPKKVPKTEEGHKAELPL